MKIIRLTTLLDFGGQEKQYMSFAEARSTMRFDYVFAAIGHGGNAEKYIREKGFEVKIFNRNPSIYNLKNIWTLFKWLRNEKPDVVHTAAAEANFHGVIAAKLAGVPTILAEEIGYPNHSLKTKLIFKLVYYCADKVVCVSESVKKFLIDIKEINASKAEVIYNPVSAPKAVASYKSEKFTIVCVGRMEKVKNQELLIRTFAALDNNDAELFLVGDGRERKFLEDIIKELKLESRVFITGFTPNPEHYLAKADLFVLPSLSEGFGIAAVEAMQYGVPCLCSKVGGLPEIIEEGVSGWLFDPNAPDVFLEKFNAVTTLPSETLVEMGRVAKERIGSRFSAEKYVVNVESLYQKLHDKSA